MALYYQKADLKPCALLPGISPFLLLRRVLNEVWRQIFIFRILSNMAQTYHARIYVTLRPSVLDPAGAAVQAGITQMGFAGISDVRIGKYVEMSVVAIDEATATSEIDKICDQLLANPVIENYRIELLKSTPSAKVGV